VLGVPLPFALEEASPTVRLRVVRDLWGAIPPEPLVREVVGQPEVERLVGSLRRDGSWQSWLHRAGISTENALTRLAELGCPLERYPFARALPPLVALLRGDLSPFVDLRRPTAPALASTRLRRVAAGLLCQSGLEDHKDVREAVEREVDRAHAFVLRARAEGLPFELRDTGTGRREWTVLPEALDADGLAVPDLYWLRAVAFVPELVGDPRVGRVLRFVRDAPYQHLADAELGVLTDGRQRVRPGFGIRCPEPAAAARDGRMEEALIVAELLARVGDSGPARRMIRFLETHLDRRGRVEINPAAFARGGGYVIRRGWVRLSSPWRAGARAIDLTFRMLLLAQLSEPPSAVRG
jgi:hypothetical protein